MFHVEHEKMVMNVKILQHYRDERYKIVPRGTIQS